MILHIYVNMSYDEESILGKYKFFNPINN